MSNKHCYLMDLMRGVGCTSMGNNNTCIKQDYCGCQTKEGLADLWLETKYIYQKQFGELK